MSDINVREARPADYSTIAAIIAEKNLRPESHCIQSSSTNDTSAIEEEIVELYAKEELLFIIGEIDGQMAGLMGCEFDESVGRGWTRGPFLTQDSWNRLPGLMLEALLAALPPGIRRLDSFLNEKNVQGQRFYLQHGFRKAGLAHVYQAEAVGQAGMRQGVCREMQPGLEPAFIALHDSVFPVTFIDGRGILGQLDEDHKLYLSANDSHVDGYIFITVDKFAGEGYIEFLAVQPELRNRGIGKALLLCALDWCFRTRGLSRVRLTVHDELVNAQAVYTSVGFEHLYTGVNNRREW